MFNRSSSWSKTKLFIVAYLVLYACSLFTQIYFPVVEKEFRGDVSDLITWQDQQIEFSYIEYPHATSTKTVLLLPDLFGVDTDLQELAEYLSKSYNVYIPLYEEIEGIDKRVSRSNRSRSAKTQQWINQKEIDSVHLIGKGYGGAMAIEMAAGLSQPRIQSLTLLESWSITELHFMGDHFFNRSVYSTLYPPVWIKNYLIPHFGWAHKSKLSHSRVQSLVELDLRSIEEQTSIIQEPVFIMAEETDSRWSSADELYRLIPQSLFKKYDPKEGSDLKIDVIISEISRFLDSVESDSAINRNQADLNRIMDSLEGFDDSKIDTVSGWTLVFMMLLIIGFTLINEDVACIGNGMLVAGGILDFQFAVMASIMGIFITDVITYWLGRRFGRPALDVAPLKWLFKKRDILWAEEKFNTSGFKLIFASRFLPGTRLPTYFTAGMVGVSFPRISTWFILAISFWVPILVGISAFIGQKMFIYLEIYQQYAGYIFVSFILLMYMGIKLLVPLVTAKGRREFAVKVLRLRQKFLKD